VGSKAREARELSDEALDRRVAETKEEMFNLRFQHATGQLDNSARLGEVRRDVARLLTIQREREISAAEGAAAQE
jgi:large subunit ribosomal protein L29